MKSYDLGENPDNTSDSLHMAVASVLSGVEKKLCAGIERTLDRHIRQSKLLLEGDLIVVVYGDDKHKEFKTKQLVKDLIHNARDSPDEIDEVIDTLEKSLAMLKKARSKSSGR